MLFSNSSNSNYTPIPIKINAIRYYTDNIQYRINRFIQLYFSNGHRGGLGLLCTTGILKYWGK